MQKKNRSGFGLIELTLALAIAGVVGFIVIRTYSEAQDAKTAKQVTDDISLVHSHVKTMRAGLGSYFGLSTPVISKGLPKSMTGSIDVGTGNINVLSSANGVIFQVAPSSTPIGNSPVGMNVAYTIRMLNDNTCRHLATADFGRETIAIAINTVFRGLVFGAPDEELKLTPAEAAQACTNGNTAGGVLNEITVYMK